MLYDVLPFLPIKTTYQVNFDIKGNEVTLSSKDLDFSNEANETIDCQNEGEDLDIAFNARYLGELLNALKTEEIQIHLSTADKAGIVIPGVKEENEELLMLVMPIVMTK